MYLAAAANTGYNKICESHDRRQDQYKPNFGYSVVLHNLCEPLAVFFIISIVAIQVTYFNQNINPILVAIVLFYRG